MSLKHILREEFRLKKFGFTSVHPRRFYMWQWRVPPLVFLLYRFVMAAYVDIWMVYLDTQQASRSQTITWAAFLTNWTYIVLAIYLTCSLAVACLHYFCLKRKETKFLQCSSITDHRNLFSETYTEPSGSQSEQYDLLPDVENETEQDHNNLPWYLKIVWIIFNAVSSVSLMVTFVVFALLVPQQDDDNIWTNENIQVHVLNSVIMVIEHLLCGVPVRLLHVIYPLTYGLIYVLFSLFFWIPDHERVMYPNVLDWNQAGHTVGMICLVGFVVIPLLHFLFFVLYRVKLVIFKRFC